MLPSAKHLHNISVYLTTNLSVCLLNEGLLTSFSSFPFQTAQPCKETINVIFTIKARHLDAAQKTLHRRQSFWNVRSDLRSACGRCVIKLLSVYYSHWSSGYLNPLTNYEPQAAFYRITFLLIGSKAQCWFSQVMRSLTDQWRHALWKRRYVFQAAASFHCLMTCINL